MKKAEILTFDEALKKESDCFNNKVVIFPTDTVWGIGCKINDVNAVKEIYKIKGRDEEKPFAILCENYNNMIESVKIKSFEKKVSNLMLHYLGALTLILPKKDVVPDYVTSGLPNVAIRIPKYSPLIKFLAKNGNMVATSVNKSGQKPLNEINEIINEFGDLVDIIILPKDKIKTLGVPSTIIMLTDNEEKIIRVGAISEKEIKDIINKSPLWYN